MFLHVFIVLHELQYSTNAVCVLNESTEFSNAELYYENPTGDIILYGTVSQSVCVCVALLASHACLPNCYCTMKQLQRETFS